MNNKKIFFIIVGILILILGIILWGYFNGEEEVINNIQEIIPQEEISDEQLRNTLISLYFINDETGEVEVESRLIDAKILLNSPYNELINLWLQGPHSEKLNNYCGKNVKINNIEIKGDCAIIDFSKEFINEYNGKKNEELNVVYCLVNTLTELTEINCVKILIDGKEGQYLGNINLSEKYYRTNN